MPAMCGMRETRDRARLAQHAGVAVGRGAGVRRQALQRDAALEPRIVAEKHLAHAAGAELFEDLVGSDRRADHGRASTKYG